MQLVSLTAVINESTQAAERASSVKILKRYAIHVNMTKAHSKVYVEGTAMLLERAQK